jgi:hypothetical protein
MSHTNSEILEIVKHPLLLQIVRTEKQIAFEIGNLPRIADRVPARPSCGNQTRLSRVSPTPLRQQ